jgi:drug/metabolite transporter (DMT)-like permease
VAEESVGAASAVGRPALDQPRTLAAIGAMVLSTVAFTIADAAMRLAAGTIPTGQSVFLRSLTSVLLVAIAAHWTGVLSSLRRALVPWMRWRCLGDAGNSLLFQAALARMPFADIMAVLQLTPLSLTAASAVFLHATVGWRRWAAVAAGLVGTLLVIKPGTTAFNVFAILAVGSVLCGTLRDVATRRLDSGIPTLLILLVSQAAVAAAGLGLAVFQGWVWPSTKASMLVVFAGAMTALGHLWMIIALRIGDVAAVAPFRYASVVLAILIGLMLFGEVPDGWSLVGMAILVLAGLYAFHRERVLLRGAASAQRPPN